MIERPPTPAFWARPGVLLGLGCAVLASLALGRVTYEERHFDALPSADPTHRALGAPPPAGLAAPLEVDLDWEVGDARVDFAPREAELGAPAPALSEVFRGLGLPGAHELLAPASPAASAASGPWRLGFQQRLRGVWLTRQGALTLTVPPDRDLLVRLRGANAAVTIGALPPGRRVYVERLPSGCRPPADFHAFGDAGWLRPGRPPLITLDVQAGSARFQDPGPPLSEVP